MSRKRWMWVGGIALAAVVLASAGWAISGQLAYANIATGYTAKQTCSCLHVSGRTMESCMSDLPEDARSSLSVTQDGDVVRASVLFGLISAEAVADGEFGCRIN